MKRHPRSRCIVPSVLISFILFFRSRDASLSLNILRNISGYSILKGPKIASMIPRINITVEKEPLNVVRIIPLIITMKPYILAKKEVIIFCQKVYILLGNINSNILKITKMNPKMKIK